MTLNISHLVFDLGGVIVELRGTPIHNDWLDNAQTVEAVWEKWLTSKAPRAYESGKIDKDTFADMIVDELSLKVCAKEFLDYFTQLPIGPYAGAIDYLQALRPTYKTALFSNSNSVHWERKMNEMKLDNVFDFHFASHLMGKVKPDIEAFEQVVAELAVPPSQILFFDDNQMNVDAAISTGMHAKRVVGFEQLPSAMAEFGL